MPAQRLTCDMLLQLKSSKYGSRQDFQADFHQMLEVCQLYNTAASLAAHPGTVPVTTARCTLRADATLPVNSAGDPSPIVTALCTVLLLAWLLTWLRVHSPHALRCVSLCKGLLGMSVWMSSKWARSCMEALRDL